MPPPSTPCNPIRVLALAVILQAQRDATNRRIDALAWLRSEVVGEICDKMGVDQGALLRRTAERIQRRPGACRNYVGGRKPK